MKSPSKNLIDNVCAKTSSLLMIIICKKMLNIIKYFINSEIYEVTENMELFLRRNKMSSIIRLNICPD